MFMKQDDSEFGEEMGSKGKKKKVSAHHGGKRRGKGKRKKSSKKIAMKA